MPTFTIERRAHPPRWLLWGAGLALWLALWHGAHAQAQDLWPNLLAQKPAHQGGGDKDAAVIVGLEDYVFAPDVPGALDNARAWFVFLSDARGVPLSNIKLLKNSDGTREKIQHYVQEAAQKVQPGGTLWFIFIGHGAPSKDGKDGLLVGADAQQDALSIYARALPRQDLLAWLTAGRQTHTTVVLDTCFSGLAPQGEPLAPGLQPLIPLAPQLQSPATIFSAGASDQLAGPLPGARWPAFSYLLLGALRGWGDLNGDGKVTAQEARDYAQKALDLLLTDRSQTPALWSNDPHLALTKGRQLEAGPDLGQLALKLSKPALALEAPIEPLRLKRAADPPPSRAESGARFVTTPEGLPVALDGKPACSATPCALALKPGRYEATLGGDCSIKKRLAVEVRAGQTTLVEATLEQRAAAIEVKAVGPDERPAQARVWVDGQPLGWAPGTFPVTTCAKRLEVGAQGEPAQRFDLMLREGRTASFVVRISNAKPPKAAKPSGMVYVEAGPFSMGSDGEKNAGPKRQVTLGAFWLDRHEVSVGDYARCAREGACGAPSLTAENCAGAWSEFNHWSKEGAKPGRLRQPINCVSWSQARAFCAWAGKRLPTEAEWEKAARGTDGRRYPWGSAPPGSPKTELGNFADRSAARVFPGWEVLDGYDDGYIGTAPVDAFPDGASPYGAEQMAGNVWEWVEDSYEPAWYAQAPERDPVCRLPSAEKVIRGGSMYMAPAWLRTYARGHQRPDTAADSVGFRCALDG